MDVRTPDIDTVLLCVQDRGIGIPHGELKRIFNRFYRAGKSRGGAGERNRTGSVHSAFGRQAPRW